MKTKLVFMLGCLAAMGPGCMTAPNLSSLITTSKSSKTDSKPTVDAPAAPEVAVRRSYKAVRAADVTPGQTVETIQALQDELDAAAK